VQRHFRYWSFVSYSHTDRLPAERLHRALETYRIPHRLVGLDSPFGPVPERLKPVFRDRDELDAGSQLGPKVRHALEVSRSLIVVCSPDAAASRWVDAECSAFLELHPDAPVFCVLVAGEPLSTHRECLPTALRRRFSPGRTLAETSPIAVDLRPGGDGWPRAVHKIAAGLTGLPLDQFVQRDAQRRHRRMASLAAATAVLALVLGGLAFEAYRARDQARFQRAQAEGLIEFMLVDLRKKLEPHGRLDALESVGGKVLAYYDMQDPARLDFDSLGRRARALHLIGEIGDRRSDVQVARQAFISARKATAELLARAPDDPKRLYDHAQSVYWNGYMDWQYGDLRSAERSLKQYAELAERLSRMNAGDRHALAEVGYAHSNLGTLLMDQGRAREAILEFRESLRIDRKRIAMHGKGIDVQLDLGQDRAWLSSAYLAIGDMKLAIAQREAELELYEQLSGQAPRDAKVMEAKMFAHHQMGDLAFAAGDLPRARSELQRAVSAAEANRDLDESRTAWMHSLAGARTSLARLARLDGDLARAREHLRRAQEIIDTRMLADPENLVWRLSLQEYASAERASVFLAAGELGPAEDEMTRARQRLQEFPETGVEAFRALHFRIRNAFLRARLESARGNGAGVRSSLDELVAVAGKERDRLDPASGCYFSTALALLDAPEKALHADECEPGARTVRQKPNAARGRDG